MTSARGEIQRRGICHAQIEQIGAARMRSVSECRRGPACTTAPADEASLSSSRSHCRRILVNEVSRLSVKRDSAIDVGGGVESDAPSFQCAGEIWTPDDIAQKLVCGRWWDLMLYGI